MYITLENELIRALIHREILGQNIMVEGYLYSIEGVKYHIAPLQNMNKLRTANQEKNVGVQRYKKFRK